MRFLTFILLLSLAWPAMPVMACDAVAGGHDGPTDAAGVHAGHPPAREEAAHNSGIASEDGMPADGISEHGCCDDGAPAGGCDPSRHCASGTSAPAIAARPDADFPSTHLHLDIPRSGVALPPSHSSPPYRPPSA